MRSAASGRGRSASARLERSRAAALSSGGLRRAGRELSARPSSSHLTGAGWARRSFAERSPPGRDRPAVRGPQRTGRPASDPGRASRACAPAPRRRRKPAAARRSGGRLAAHRTAASRAGLRLAAAAKAAGLAAAPPRGSAARLFGARPAATRAAAGGRRGQAHLPWLQAGRAAALTGWLGRGRGAGPAALAALSATAVAAKPPPPAVSERAAGRKTRMAKLAGRRRPAAGQDAPEALRRGWRLVVLLKSSACRRPNLSASLAGAAEAGRTFRRAAGGQGGAPHRPRRRARPPPGSGGAKARRLSAAIRRREQPPAFAAATARRAAVSAGPDRAATMSGPHAGPRDPARRRRRAAADGSFPAAGGTAPACLQAKSQAVDWAQDPPGAALLDSGAQEMKPAAPATAGATRDGRAAAARAQAA